MMENENCCTVMLIYIYLQQKSNPNVLITIFYKDVVAKEVYTTRPRSNNIYIADLILSFRNSVPNRRYITCLSIVVGANHTHIHKQKENRNIFTFIFIIIYVYLLDLHFNREENLCFYVWVGQLRVFQIVKYNYTTSS